MTKMTTHTEKDTGQAYHHGDLRNALIVAAAELIEHSGSVDFAMIEAARRAGVSSAAPYRHFKSKDALLEAVAELAFYGLTEVSRKAIDGMQRGSEESIISLGRNYIGYIVERPQFYDLMWGDHSLRALDSGAAELKSNGFYILKDQVEAWCEAAGATQEDPQEIATKLWASVHGLASLALNGHIERFSEGADIYQLLDGLTRTFLRGLKQTP
ncbi:MAG: TetR/AcrR family transcriptional regulator [Halieaceae bacterium]